MIASPSQRQTPQHGESSDMGSSGVDGASKTMTMSASTTNSSPVYTGSNANAAGSGAGAGAEAAGGAGTNSESLSHQQHFNIESFDFGADFSLPTSLDELSIFHNQQSNSTGPNSVGSRSVGGPPSSDGMAGSPRNVNFSPRSTILEHHLHSRGASRTQSPHPLSMSTHETTSGRSGEGGGSINNADLHNLLMAVQNSSLPPSHHNHQSQQRPQPGSNLDGSPLNLTEMEKFLVEKEQADRMQNLQTGFLRQQFESLQRQQQAVSGSEGSQQIPANMNASQLMQQLQQFAQQQEHNSSTPTPHNARFATFGQQQHGYSDSMNASAGYSSQAQKIDMSAMSQYGLVTPLSSGAFARPHQAPFVSPLHMPSSTQGGMMDGPRAYDPNMVNGTFTPLESPAITPASVFSNMGSNTNSQDMFSPLTSPALRPHTGGVNEDIMLPPSSSPYHGPTMPKSKAKSKGRASPHVGPQGRKTTTPTASPVTMPTKSVPRKNRSTTAEARANRARPSPLVKPVTAITTTRKRTESLNGLPSPLGGSVTNGASPARKSSQADSQFTGFPPLSAGSGSTKPMDASPSEGAASTPSPIDLNTSSQMPPPNGKPMTPSSIMGIHSNAKSANASKLTNAQKGKGKPGAENGKQVSFVHAGDSPGSLQNILPGGFPAADREAWLSIKSGGGLESRRTSHKAAEQKRRDSLKYCFDELRGMLPAITLDDDAPGGSSLGPDGLPEDQDEEEFSIEEVGDAESARIANRAISKVALLRHSNEYLIRLKNRLARRDHALEFCRKQVMELHARLGYPIEQQEGLLIGEAGQASMNVEYDHDTDTLPSNRMDVS